MLERVDNVLSSTGESSQLLVIAVTARNELGGEHSEALAHLFFGVANAVHLQHLNNFGFANLLDSLLSRWHLHCIEQLGMGHCAFERVESCIDILYVVHLVLNLFV
ncbi:hypothetical protein D3C77_492970 [compost metagenome]